MLGGRSARVSSSSAYARAAANLRGALLFHSTCTLRSIHQDATKQILELDAITVTKRSSALMPRVKAFNTCECHYAG